jgi:dihydroxyacetone kinase-like protein
MGDKITAAQIYRAMESLCDSMELNKEYLSDLDGAIGDGDHGVNMAKCFRELKKRLPESQGRDIGTLLKNIGLVVLNSVGGAMGALYGTFFLRLAQECGGKEEIDLDGWVRMFKAGEKGIRDIGKANVGDKTMLDTLAAAVQALEQSAGQGESLGEALKHFEEGARKGMESTKDMIARIGRASRLGERTIGHQDAGATSCYFILKAFAQAGS